MLLIWFWGVDGSHLCGPILPWPLCQAPLGCSLGGLSVSSVRHQECYVVDVFWLPPLWLWPVSPHPDSQLLTPGARITPQAPSCPEREVRSPRPICVLEGRWKGWAQGGRLRVRGRQKQKPVKITFLTLLMTFPFPSHPSSSVRKGKSG